MTQVHQDTVLSSYGPRKDLTGTAREWHNRMGHINQNAIRKLQEKTQGVIVTDMDSYDTNCEIPYEKVHLDLIQMPEAYDGSTQALHLQCDFCRMNHVYTIKDKRQVTVLQTIKDF
ncbi:hypothetical protein GMDG_08809, partial [Pseudogymnoascus destructans 20631-21]